MKSSTNKPPFASVVRDGHSGRRALAQSIIAARPRSNPMNPLRDYVRYETRRQFLSQGANAVGWAAFASLLGHDRPGRAATPTATDVAGSLPGLAHFAPKAKRVIYLHMVGGPSQLDLYDYKPKM